MTTTPIHDELVDILRRRPEVAVTVGRPGAGPVDAVDEAGRTPEDVGWNEDAEWAVHLAAEEAESQGHACCGTGHLLLGLVRAGGPVGGLLAASGVGLPAARRAIAALEPTRVGADDEGAGPPAWSSAAEASLAGARRGAARARRGQAGTADILCALLVRPEGQATSLLESMDLDRAGLADAALALTHLAERPAPPRTALRSALPELGRVLKGLRPT